MTKMKYVKNVANQIKKMYYYKQTKTELEEAYALRTYRRKTWA